jgi:hypothetical protein
MAIEIVDIVKPPAFEYTGEVKPREQAYDDGDWIKIFNLWILRSDPVESIVFQLRRGNATFAPNKLDVAAGGHYSAGETMYDGLREGEEELGKKYNKNSIQYLGPLICLNYDTKKRLKKNIVYAFAVVDNEPLSTFTLEKQEVDGLFIIPVTDLLKVLDDPSHQFKAEGINSDNMPTIMNVTIDSFIPEDIFRYKYKIAINTRRIIRGEKDIFI